MATLILISLLPLIVAAPVQLENITITVPTGTSNHSDPNILCVPTTAQDVLLFFIGNYIAHATTVKTIPGQKTIPTIVAVALALLFPVSGVVRGLNAIRQMAIRGKTPLQKALKAGALCHVIRTGSWRPKHGDVVRDLQITQDISRARSSVVHEPSGSYEQIEIEEHINSEGSRLHGDAIVIAIEALCYISRGDDDANFDPATQPYSQRHGFFGFSDRWTSAFSGREVHGTCILPPGYTLAILHPNANVLDLGQPDPFDDAELLDDTEREATPISFERIETNATQQAAANQESDDHDPTLARIQQTVDPQSKDDDNTEPKDNTIVPVQLSSRLSLGKGIIAVLQLIFSSVTIYKTRGDQITRYGYAAFGLTVTPYMLMSLVNLVGTMVTPDYTHVYLVSSECMEEAGRRKDALFQGVVGKIGRPSKCDFASNKSKFRGNKSSVLIDAKFEVIKDDLVLRPFSGSDRIIAQTKLGKCNNDGVYICQWSNNIYARDSTLNVKVPDRSYAWIESRSKGSKSGLKWGGLVVGCLSIILIGSLSHFHAGSSTIVERLFTMAWLVFGIAFGLVFFTVPLWNNLWVLLPYFIPAIGGFVVVGNMLWNYGNCVSLY
jgi:hypothetical protein